MTIQDNYSLSRLFISKDITIFTSMGDFNIHLKTVREAFTEEGWLQTYHLLTLEPWELKKELDVEVKDSLEFIKNVLFIFSVFAEYKQMASTIKRFLQELIPLLELDDTQKNLIVNNIIITPEIWDYIVYLLKLSWGEKVTQPLTFNSPEERAFYLQQQEYEAKIRQIKGDKEGDKDGLIKALLAITYSFPSLTLDYLYDQTMAQIHWLQGMAAGEVSYRINAEIAASGNMKKGKKLEFFIK